MTKGKLIELGLTEDQAKQVMDGLNGAFVPKSRFNEVNSELQNAKTSIKERDTQLEALRQSTGDVEALKTQIAQLQTENIQKDAAHAEEVKQIRLETAVDKALSDAKAINPATVKPLLSAFLEKADLDDNGTIRGLADEIGKLAKTEGTSFLFKADTANAAPPVSGASPAGSVTTPPDAKTTSYEGRLADARQTGNSALAVAIKREAASEGIELF